MRFLRQLLDEETAVRKLRQPHTYPTFDQLKRFLETKLGATKIKLGKRSINVTMPWFDLPEKVEDMANEVLRRAGLEYQELTPGKPKQTHIPTKQGKTNSFQIFGPYLDMGEEGGAGELGQELKDKNVAFLKSRPVRLDDKRRSSIHDRRKRRFRGI